MPSRRPSLPLACLPLFLPTVLLASCGGDDALTPFGKAMTGGDGGAALTTADGGLTTPGSDGGDAGPVIHTLPTTNQIGALRLYQPALYTSNATVTALAVVPGSSLVASVEQFQPEGSWQVVVQAPDGANPAVLTSTTAYPHTQVDGFSVSPSVVLLTLHDLELGLFETVVVPVGGASPFVLESTTISLLEFSADGTRINYVVGDGKNPWQVKTVLLSSPTPVVLGTIPATETLANVPFFLANSFISNVPEVALTSSMGTFVYRLGQPPLQIDGAKSASVNLLGGFAGSETVFLSSGEVYDLPSGKSLGMLTASASPDGHSGVIQGKTFTILHDVGAPTTATLSKSTGSASVSWSKDSSHVVVYTGATESWDIVDAAKGTVQHGSYSKPDATLVDSSYSGDHLFFSRDNGTTPDTLSLDAVAADGSGVTTFSTAAPTRLRDDVFASGIVFEEGIGLYGALASGAGRARLDPAFAGETNLTTGELEVLHHDWVFEPTSQRVVFTNIASFVDLSSDYDTRMALLSTTIAAAAGSLVTFPPASKVTGQIRDVTPVTAGPAAGQLFLQSVDGSRADSSDRGNLSIGNLLGEPLTRVSPTDDDAGAIFGPGVAWFDNPPSPVTLSGENAVVYTYRPTPTTANVLVQAVDGGALSTWSGQTFRQVSRDGTLVALTDPVSDHLSVGRLVAGGSVTPIFPSLTVEDSYGCYGCRTPNVQFNVDDQLAFDALGRLIFNTSTGVQLGNADGTGLVSLGGDSMYVSADGTRAILPSSTTGDIVAETLAAPPSAQTIAHMATYFGSSADDEWLLYSTDTAVRAVKFDGSGDRQMIAASSANITAMAQTTDGQTWVAAVFTGTFGDPSCQSTLVGFTPSTGDEHTVASLPSCTTVVSSLTVTPDGAQVTYGYQASIGHVDAFTVPFGGGTPVALSPADETAVVFATSPTTHHTLIETVKTDGSHEFAVVDATTGARTIFGPSTGNSRVTQFTYLDDTHAPAHRRLRPAG